MTEQKAALQTPATWVNRFSITLSEIVRIGFLEQPHARCAVVMSLSDAKALRDLLVQVLEGK